MKGAQEGPVRELPKNDLSFCTSKPHKVRLFARGWCLKRCNSDLIFVRAEFHTFKCPLCFCVMYARSMSGLCFCAMGRSGVVDLWGRAAGWVSDESEIESRGVLHKKGGISRVMISSGRDTGANNQVRQGGGGGGGGNGFWVHAWFRRWHGKV